MRTGRSVASVACALIALLLGCDAREAEPAPSEPIAAATQATSAAAPSTGRSIRGVLSLAPNTPAPTTGTLFVIARGEGAGPPLAVKRLELGSFPLPFEIGPADAAHAGGSFDGPIFLGARLDTDGDASTREAGQLSGVASRVLHAGDSGIELVLVASAHEPRNPNAEARRELEPAAAAPPPVSDELIRSIVESQ